MGQHEMTWEHAMEHVQTPRVSPAVGASDKDHGLTSRLTRGKNGRTRLWRYFSSKSAGRMFTETPRVLVERRWRYQNF